MRYSLIKSRKWLFFDVGNVILNDDPGVAFVYKKIHDAILKMGYDLSFDEFLEERGRLFRERKSTLPRSLALKYMSEQEADDLRESYNKEGFPRWKELNPLIPGAKDLVQMCAEKYNLGIIANQPKECQDVLEEHDLLKHFKVLGFSDAVGMKKPDINFFQWALNIANTSAEDSIMLGDRVDNDISPAKSLGFLTIHLKLNVYDKVQDLPINDTLKSYLPHVHKHNISMREPINDNETPHYAADNFDQIRKILL